MKKNGFTLIELLAVIVILAIIALIATPIILGIINDAKVKSQERSVELYASAVRNGIAAYQLREMKEVAAGTYTSETLPFNVEFDGNIECAKIDIYEDGSVYVEGCTVNGEETTYTYGKKKEKAVKISEVCTLVSGTALTQGAKYNCNVDPNKEAYTFYVLETPASGATNVNLIMDSNITSTGEAVKDANPTDKGLLPWITKSDYIREDIGGTEANYGSNGNWNKGPITAIEYLQTATATWTNVNSQTVSTFTDNTGATHAMAKEYTLNARMPYLSEVLATGCTASWNSCPLWMVDYLKAKIDYYPERTAVSGVDGYWTLSSCTDDSSFAWYVGHDGHPNMGDGLIYVNDAYYGVRPVINLSI